MSIFTVGNHIWMGDKMKTLIFDGGNIITATWFVAYSNQSITSDEDKYAYWRYLFLNSILTVKMKYDPISEIIIALDSTSWRLKEFPYYKARRKLKPKPFVMDWKKINVELELIAQAFPFKFIKVEDSEGDDIIAVLAKEIKNEVIVISRDKDFLQLCMDRSITIWNPFEEREITGGEAFDPYIYLIEHIVKGDAGDDIPNITSKDNHFMMDDAPRQKSISKKLLQEVHEKSLEEWARENNVYDGYRRNKLLIDFSEIPDTVQLDIKYDYRQYPEVVNSWANINRYLSLNNIPSLMEFAGKFCLEE